MNRHLLCLLAFVLTLAGCSSDKATANLKVSDFQTSQRGGNPIIRIACIGDSITFGAGVEGRETNSYPAQLAILLGPKFEVKNFGRSGATLMKNGDLPYWTTDEFKGSDQFAPDVIILKLGTNDTKPQNWKGKDAFINDYKAMIDHYRSLPSHPKIWACLPVPVYEDKWGINAATLEQAIDAIQAACENKKIPLIDLNDALTGHASFFPDKIHPNAAGAALMAHTIYQALRP